MPDQPPGAQTPAKDLEPWSLPLWLRISLPGLVIAVLVVRRIAPISDPDAFWHIATGAWLVEHWQFVTEDPFSASSSRAWTLHEWVPEVVAAQAHAWFGLPGVAWLFSLALAALGLTMWWVTRARTSLLVSLLLMAVGTQAMGASLSARPHLVSFALVMVCTAAWQATAADLKARWWLVPLTWVWACTHGMWFVGPAIGGVTLLGMLLDGVRLRSVLRPILVTVLCVVAAGLTPVGPRLLLVPLEVGGYAGFVAEWLPASLANYYLLAFMVLAGACVLAWSRSGRQVRWSELTVLALAVGLALLYTRTVAVGAAIALPLVAAALQQSLGREREPVSRAEIGVTAGFAAVSLAVAALAVPNIAARESDVPSALNGALADQPAGTVICNDYDVGGWLIFRHPHLLPTIDGRTEVYSLEHVRHYYRFLAAAPGWQDYPVENACTVALLKAETPVIEAMTGDGRWSVAQSEKTYQLLVRAP